MKETEEQYIDFIAKMSTQLHERDQHINSLYIWLSILGSVSAGLLMIIIF